MPLPRHEMHSHQMVVGFTGRSYKNDEFDWSFLFRAVLCVLIIAHYSDFWSMELFSQVETLDF